MPKHALNIQQASWQPGQFPQEIASWAPSSTDTSTVSTIHGTGSRTMLNGYAAKAVVEYVKGQNSSIALVNTGNGMTYSSEMPLDDKTLLIATVNRPSAQTNTLNLRASLVTTSADGASNAVFTPIPPLRPDSVVDLSPVYICVLAHLLAASVDARNDLNVIADAFSANAAFEAAEVEFRRLNDAMTSCLDSNFFSMTIPGNNIDMLVRQSVELGSLAGEVVCGVPRFLMGGAAVVPSKSLSFAEAKKKFQAFARTHRWTDRERELIPVFPDDYKVPDEAIKIATLYVNTRADRRPMNNFFWRGTTSIGKSTGVELMAGFLDIPLLRVTCSTSMETQDFLSNFVPEDARQDVSVGELPSFMEISADPASAYLALTGEEKDDVTCDECLVAYGQAVAARSQKRSGARFVHVESNYVKALTQGYIVEVQECSRIKDAGVLVGLNEFDRPGAIIPLVDGSFKRRHPDAMVIYTDNIGYASCRPIDPSVLRRVALIIDSYELPKEKVIERVKYNTGFQDVATLDQMYGVWLAVQEYCKEHDISDGSVSVTELEMWVQATKVDGLANMRENCRVCVVSKATAEISEQESIMSDVVDIRLA